MMATVVRAVMPGSSISRVIKGIEAADKGDMTDLTLKHPVGTSYSDRPAENEVFAVIAI